MSVRHRAFIQGVFQSATDTFGRVRTYGFLILVSTVTAQSRRLYSYGQLGIYAHGMWAALRIYSYVLVLVLVLDTGANMHQSPFVNDSVNSGVISVSSDVLRYHDPDNSPLHEATPHPAVRMASCWLDSPW